MRRSYRRRPTPPWKVLTATTLFLGFPLLLLAILGSFAALFGGNPIPLLLIGGGAFWLISTDSSHN